MNANSSVLIINTDDSSECGDYLSGKSAGDEVKVMVTGKLRENIDGQAIIDPIPGGVAPCGPDASTQMPMDEAEESGGEDPVMQWAASKK